MALYNFCVKYVINKNNKQHIFVESNGMRLSKRCMCFGTINIDSSFITIKAFFSLSNHFCYNHFFC